MWTLVNVSPNHRPLTHPLGKFVLHRMANFSLSIAANKCEGKFEIFIHKKITFFSSCIHWEPFELCSQLSYPIQMEMPAMANDNSPDSPPFPYSSPQINLLDLRIEGEMLHQLTVVKTDPTKIGTICVASIPIQVNNSLGNVSPYLGGRHFSAPKKRYLCSTIILPRLKPHKTTSSVLPYFSFHASQKIPLATAPFFPLSLSILFQIVDDSLTTSPACLPFFSHRNGHPSLWPFFTFWVNSI
jgi:hypothetical protein